MKSFEEYLLEKTPEMRRALTDDTYKMVWQKEHRSATTLPDSAVNSELATFGDAILKFLLAEKFFAMRVENITECKKNYESDRVLTTVIGRHYDIIRRLRFDKQDRNIPRNYAYTDRKKKSYKYIATACEAALGAVYLKHGMRAARTVVDEWYELITAQGEKE